MSKVTRISTGHRLYTLDSDNNVIPARNHKFVDDSHPESFIIDRTELAYDKTVKILVSTLFLGREVNGGYFETLIVGGEFNSSRWVYRTHSDAVNGHDEIVSVLTEGYYRPWNIKEIGHACSY